jgi:hypothetical protein
MSNAQTAIVQRKPNGQWPKGVSGNTGGAGARARRELNNDTIRAMHAAFREGGRQAIDKVMKQQPAIFLKLLVLLVPRELEVTHGGGVKAMSDGEIEAAIAAIQGMLAARAAGENAKVIEGTAAPVEESPPPESRKGRKVRKPRTLDVVPNDADPASA